MRVGDGNNGTKRAEKTQHLPWPIRAECSCINILISHLFQNTSESPNALAYWTGMRIDPCFSISILGRHIYYLPPITQIVAMRHNCDTATMGRLNCHKAHLEHIHAVLIITPYHDRCLQTFSPRRHTPSRPFLAAHCPCPQFQCQRTGHWGLGRAGRVAGEPEPASGVASLAGHPRRVVPDEAATLRSRTGPTPRLRQPLK